MIHSISIVESEEKITYSFNPEKNKIIIDNHPMIRKSMKSFDIKIVFSQSITSYRNHDYTWAKCNKDVIINEFSPKIIKLEDETLIQPNCLLGIWEIKRQQPNTLLWRFDPKDSKPITNYREISNQKVVVAANSRVNFPEELALLVTSKPVEFSRSKIPFSAIAVFTDHCDFDTVDNLKLQREFFKKNGIKITKGFFLNHFSKRDDNASYENDSEELIRWENDGHEMCYHSLSQSIKSDEESFNDFYSFKPPFQNSTTWIDHGYQPYNFSLFQNNAIPNSDYEDILFEKKITNLWNYIDAGTTTEGVINQLNSSHFTLRSFLKGNNDLSFVKKVQLMIKNIIFHYYGDERLILKYKSTATNFKKFISQKKPSYFFSLIKDLLLISNKIISVFLFWNIAKDQPYKLAKYSPILYKHIIHQKEFTIFQTVEMVDFKKSLNPKNIDDFVNEKGVFIAHTYFSVPMKYHLGRMFLNETTIDTMVANNFEYLGKKIQEKTIWNPTLKELIEYWSEFEKIILDIDCEGNIFVKSKTELIYRTAN